MTPLAIAGAFWTVTHAFGFLVTLWLWQVERCRFYLLFSTSWFFMSLWGVSLEGSPWMQFANSVAIPPLASVTGLAAIFLLAKHVRGRVVTIYTASNGDIRMRAFGEDPLSVIPMQAITSEDDMATVIYPPRHDS